MLNFSVVLIELDEILLQPTSWLTLKRKRTESTSCMVMSNRQQVEWNISQRKTSQISDIIYIYDSVEILSPSKVWHAFGAGGKIVLLAEIWGQCKKYFIACQSTQHTVNNAQNDTLMLVQVKNGSLCNFLGHTILSDGWVVCVKNASTSFSCVHTGERN